MKVTLSLGIFLFLSGLCVAAPRVLVPLELRYFPEEAELFINKNPRQIREKRGYFGFYGEVELPFTMRIEKEGYKAYTAFIEDLSSPVLALRSGGGHTLRYEAGVLRIEAKLERLDSSLFRIASLPSGEHPKSVVFSPDETLFFAAPLDGYGIDVYDSTSFAHHSIELANNEAGLNGYVEFAVLEKSEQLWVSQMKNGRIHVLDLESMEKLADFSSQGIWTKVICFDREENYAFISNWLSRDVSVFRTHDFSYLGSFNVGGIPRGLAVAPDNRNLFVADYENGRLLSLDISFLADPDISIDAARKKISESRQYSTLGEGTGAKRHIAIADSLDRIFVSDMYHGSIFVYRLSNGEQLQSVRVGQKLNTIALDPQERFLYISSRGTNNPKSYLIPGPDFGKVYVMDTHSLKIVDWTWGMNQPTGLAVSPGGNMLVFSNFLDSQLEVYDISSRSASHPLVRALGMLGGKIRNALYRGNEAAAPVKLVQKHAEASGAGREE